MYFSSYGVVSLTLLESCEFSVSISTIVFRRKLWMVGRFVILTSLVVDMLLFLRDSITLKNSKIEILKCQILRLTLLAAVSDCKFTAWEIYFWGNCHVVYILEVQVVEEIWVFCRIFASLFCWTWVGITKWWFLAIRGDIIDKIKQSLRCFSISYNTIFCTCYIYCEFSSFQIRNIVLNQKFKKKDALTSYLVAGWTELNN